MRSEQNLNWLTSTADASREAGARQCNVSVMVFKNKETVCSVKPAGNTDVTRRDATEQMCVCPIGREKMEGLAAVFLNGHQERTLQCSFKVTGQQLGSSASFMLE